MLNERETKRNLIVALGAKISRKGNNEQQQQQRQ